MPGFFLIFFILLIFFIVIVTQNMRLHRRVNDLEWKILPLNSILDRLKELEDKVAAFKIPGKIPEKKTEPAQAVKAVAPTPPAEPLSKPIEQQKAEEIKKPDYVFMPRKSRTREEWESFIGGKLLNRIGALALIIGLGFFLKYAFDNNWISEGVRVILGGLVGFACLGLAYRTHKKGFQIFAQGLVGAGISILYLSVYASFNFYQLVPQWVAFILMSLVTVISLAIGIYYNSLAVGMLGWAGGFLTPIMLSTGVANEIGLFTYIALLNVGLLGVVLAKKEWRIIEPLSLAGTWIIYFAWYFQFYNQDDLIITVFFISIFWALFLAADIARLRFEPDVKNTVQNVIGPVNLILFYDMLYFLVDKDHHAWMGGVTLLLALVYIGVYFWLRSRVTISDLIAVRYILSAIALAVIATSIQFQDFTTVLLWSTEAALLFWAGIYWKRRFVYFSATILFAIAALKFIYTDGAFSYEPIEQFTLLINQRSLTLAVMCLALGSSAWLMKDSAKENPGLHSMFHFASCIAIFALLTVEINDFFQFKMIGMPYESAVGLRFLRPLVLALAWCVLSLPLIWVALRSKVIPVLASGLGILALGACSIIFWGFQYVPIAEYQPILNLRFGAIVLFIGGILINQWMIAQNKNVVPWINKVPAALRIGMVALILVLLTGETIDYFEKQIILLKAGSDDLWQLKNLRQLSLSGIWLLYSVALMAYGFWRSHRSFRLIAFVLFGFTILKIFIYDLSYLEILYKIFLFIGLSIILIAISFYYQKYKHIIFGTDKERTA